LSEADIGIPLFVMLSMKGRAGKNKKDFIRD